MDILKDRVKALYFKYLVAASGSAMVASIFGMIDAMMVGKYHGPSGNAALGYSTLCGASSIVSVCLQVSGDRCCLQINEGKAMKNRHRSILRFPLSTALYFPSFL